MLLSGLFKLLLQVLAHTGAHGTGSGGPGGRGGGGAQAGAPAARGGGAAPGAGVRGYGGMGSGLFPGVGGEFQNGNVHFSGEGG